MMTMMTMMMMMMVIMIISMIGIRCLAKINRFPLGAFLALWAVKQSYGFESPAAEAARPQRCC
eukprot:2748223-Amphidinium_carterae.1